MMYMRLYDKIIIGRDKMEQDFLKIKELLLEYIKLILNNYSNCNRKKILNIINYDSEIIKFNSSNAISFVVRDGVLLLPKAAYQIFPLLKQYKNYGAKPNNGRNIEDYLDTNTTYMEYINHVIEAGLSVYDYFEESLLHEAMHICGSQGGTPLEEGINELKTRELAQKNNIKIAAYGYSKEVEIAKRLQQIIGKELMDELTFIPSHERKKIIANKLGDREAELYESISSIMKEKSASYYDKLLQVNDPFEKAKSYESVDYSEVYQIIDNYKRKNYR